MMRSVAVSDVCYLMIEYVVNGVKQVVGRVRKYVDTVGLSVSRLDHVECRAQIESR